MSEHKAPTRYERSGTGLEFERGAFFSDAVYAIAMTLLVVGIGVPHVRSENLGRALSNLDQEIVSFFIGFIVLGFYWLSHHALVAKLSAMNTTFLAVNLVYLAFVAFLPFPTAIAGANGDIPLGFILFASSLAAVSILEVVLYLIAHHYDLMKSPPKGREYVHDIIAQLLPGIIFLLSIPVAFVDTTLGFLFWTLSLPSEAVLDRIYPATPRT